MIAVFANNGLWHKPRVQSDWPTDPQLAFLNHGSFGSCPTPVRAHQDQLRARLERQPVQFFVRELEAELDAVRGFLAPELGAASQDVCFVANTTFGIASVLGALPFEPDDEILITSHGYNAANNAARRVAGRAGARVVEAELPLVTTDPDEITEAILAATSPHTRLALIDWVTSPTGMVLPIADIVKLLSELGIDTLVDAAHAPGMVPLDLDALGATYVTGNFHKWVCAPKTSAFLYVQRDKQSLVFPAVTSHGMNSPRTDRSRYRLEFDWVGTQDVTPILSVPRAYTYLRELRGGLPAHMEANRLLALQGRRLLESELGLLPVCPESMVGSMAALVLPPAKQIHPQTTPFYADPLQEALLREHGVEVPIVSFPSAPSRLVRISAQAYNSLSDYQRLADALQLELGRS